MPHPSLKAQYLVTAIFALGYSNTYVDKYKEESFSQLQIRNIEIIIKETSSSVFFRAGQDSFKINVSWEYLF